MTTNRRSPRRTALLVLHVQPIMLGRVDPGVLDQMSVAIAGARTSGVAVMYANAGYRPGYPEVDADSRARLVAANILVRGVSDQEHEKVARHEGDLVFTAARASAFTGTDLEIMLRHRDINELVLIGVTTSGTVLSTLSEGTDKGYGVTVLSDGCADPNPELHDALLALAPLPPRRAAVMTTADWLAGLA